MPSFKKVAVGRSPTGWPKGGGGGALTVKDQGSWEKWLCSQAGWEREVPRAAGRCVSGSREKAFFKPPGPFTWQMGLTPHSLRKEKQAVDIVKGLIMF